LIIFSFAYGMLYANVKNLLHSALLKLGLIYVTEVSFVSEAGEIDMKGRKS